VFAPVLALLQADAAAHFRIAPLRLVPCDYQERPASHIMRVEVWRDGDASWLSRLFVKVFKPRRLPGGADAMRDRVVRDYTTTRRVHRWMSSHGDLGAVPPVACYPEHLTIVTEEVGGPTLLSYLQQRTSWFGTAGSLDEVHTTMATVGRWLRVFQGIDVPGTYGTIEGLQEYIDVRLQRLVAEAATDFAENDRQRILEHIAVLGRQVGSEELGEVAVHSDMALGNLLVSGHRIVVLDFAMTKHGNPLLDLTRLFLQLDLLAVKPQTRRSVIRRLQQAMVGGFDAALTPERPLFRLFLLLHRINHLTTLSVNRASFLEEMYNGMVRRSHRQWLAAELQGGGAAALRA
jgi:hypothetical protein